MAKRIFNINLDEASLEAARRRAESEGKTLEQVLAGMVESYAKGYSSIRLTTYTVQRGDSLSRIARKFYGDPHKYPLIQGANNLSDPGRIWVGQVLIIPLPPEAGAPPAPPEPPRPEPAPEPQPEPAPSPPPSPSPSPEVDPCAPIPGERYGSLPIVGPPTDRPAAEHGDLNLALRGYTPTRGQAGLIDMSGPTDPRAPQLTGLFADRRIPTFTGLYRVHEWDWATNSRGQPITAYEVTLAGLRVTPGEPIHVPNAGYDIGRGYQVLVLYADPERLTLKYTGEDSVVSGYTLHLENVCPAPDLLALYERLNAAGRRELPALRAGQALGRARGQEIRVAIRDTGRFMDPRVRKDWWVS